MKINKKIIKELETLFDMVSPVALKISITDIFFSYLCNTDTKDYKPEMKEIATDFYFLIKFLEAAEAHERNASKLKKE